MASDHRTTINSVEQLMTEMNEQIRSYDFLSALRQLECGFPDKPRIGDAVRVRDEIVRLSQHVNLGFKGHALHSIKPAKGPYEQRLHVNFFGLLGSNGPMPLHLTEYADQRSRHHADPTFKEFLDLFNHRMLSLFYRASVQFDASINFDRADSNAYDEFLGALCGLSPSASANRDSISDLAKRYYPGWLSGSSKSPDGIVSIVGDYFDLPVSVEEWVGAWLPLPRKSLASLGARTESEQLGRALYIGRRVWSIRHKFKIQLGPVNWQTFSSFKPGSQRAKTLHDLVRNYVGDEWDWDLELILDAGEVRPMTLDRSRSLGFDTWMKGNRGKKHSVQSVLLNKKVIAQLAH